MDVELYDDVSFVKYSRQFLCIHVKEMCLFYFFDVMSVLCGAHDFEEAEDVGAEVSPLP